MLLTHISCALISTHTRTLLKKITGKKCNLIDLHRQELERIVNLSDEALRLRVMNLHSYVFLRKQREEKKAAEEERAKGTYCHVLHCTVLYVVYVPCVCLRIVDFFVQ